MERRARRKSARRRLCEERIPMNAKLTLAVVAATLAAAPMALAQTGQPYNNDASRAGYERSSPSGLPTTSPQVRSLPDAEPDPWTDRPAGNRSWNDRATSGSTMDNTTSPRTGRVTTQSGTAGSTTGNTMDRSGTMGSTGTMQGGGQGNRQVLMNVDPNVQQRADRGQNRTELMQTSLLNYFSAAGFTAVRDFRKQGNNYVAEAQDQNGRWMTVEMDPATGTIAQVR